MKDKNLEEQRTKKVIARLRLIKFGTHLNEIKNQPNLTNLELLTMYVNYNNCIKRVDAACPLWIFKELPLVFPICPYKPESENYISGVIEFFSLTENEFLHLFDYNGNQFPLQFGGTKLNRDSVIADVGRNMIQLANARKKESHSKKEKKESESNFLKSLRIGDQRLLDFARFIVKIKFSEQDRIYDRIVLEELNAGFPLQTELNLWTYKMLASIVYQNKGYPQNEFAHSTLKLITGKILAYYHLAPEEFRHLFDLNGNQNVQQWGGKRLTQEVTGKDMAQNIIEFVISK